MKKIKLILLIITFLISIILYINFVEGYYSIDTAKIVGLGYMEYGTEYSLFDGRIVMFLICYIAEVVNIDIKSFYIILLIFSIFISSISVLKMYEIVIEQKNPKKKWMNVFVFLIAYCYIFHFMYIDNLQFAECIIMSTSILLYIIAAQKVILQDKKNQGFLFCVLGILFYQGTINIFITTAVLFLMIGKNRNDKDIIKKMLLIAKIAIATIILDFIMIHIIQNYIDSIQSDRLNTEIIENISQIISDLPKLVLDSLNLFPKFVYATLTMILLIIIYISCLKNKTAKEFYLAILLIFICYCSSLLMGMMYPDMIYMLNGRVFTSVGASLSALMIFAYVRTNIFEDRSLNKIFLILIIFYFVINIRNTAYITYLLKQENEIDKEFSYQIKAYIEEYEKETNNIVTKFAIYCIENKEGTTIEKKVLRSTKQMGLYNASIYEIYIGEKIERTFFEEDIKKQYFEEKQEKMICIGDVIYIQI